MRADLRQQRRFCTHARAFILLDLLAGHEHAEIVAQPESNRVLKR